MEAEAQEAAARRRPAQAARPTGCNGGKGGEAVGMSDATAAKNTATSDERVRNHQRAACRNNSSAVAVHLLSNACGLVNSESRMRDRRSKKQEETKVACDPAGEDFVMGNC